jgi:hypothetical protein
MYSSEVVVVLAKERIGTGSTGFRHRRIFNFLRNLSSGSTQPGFLEPNRTPTLPTPLLLHTSSPRIFIPFLHSLASMNSTVERSTKAAYSNVMARQCTDSTFLVLELSVTKPTCFMYSDPFLFDAEVVKTVDFTVDGHVYLGIHLGQRDEGDVAGFRLLRN